MAKKKSQTDTDTKELMIVTESGTIDKSYPTAKVDIMPGLPFCQWDVIKMCEFYANSKYIGGNIDDMDRDKPFYNIVNFRVTLAKVATDLDTKDVRVTADSPKFWIKSMLLQHELFNWMKEANFAAFLNKFGYVRSKYGGVVPKKFESSDKLIIDVCDWRNIATDLIDIEGGVKIEHHFMTPVELSKKKGWEGVTDALKALAKESRKNKKGWEQQVGYNTDRADVLEVTGPFPKAYLKQANAEEFKDEDLYNYSNQHYFISFINETWFMFLAEEKEDFYRYLPWEEMPGRALGRGVIEDSEEAQVWSNDAVIGEKNAMDLAGKVFAETDDPNLGGQNLLTVDNGKIWEVGENKHFNSVKLDPAAIGEYQSQIDRWEKQANYATSSYDANTGEQPPSGTPFAQTQLLNQIAERPFDFRKQEAGIFISNILRDWVIPFLIKRIEKDHILTSDFTDQELKVIDHSFAVDSANQDTIEHVISTGDIPSPEEYQGLINFKKASLTGKTRSLDIPSGYFKDWDGEVTIDLTGETQNKAAVLQSLGNIADKIMATYNPQTGKFAAFEDPRMAEIFGAIIDIAGIKGFTPASVGIDASAPAQPPQSAPAPQPQPVPPMQPAQPVVS